MYLVEPTTEMIPMTFFTPVNLKTTLKVLHCTRTFYKSALLCAFLGGGGGGHLGSFASLLSASHHCSRLPKTRCDYKHCQAELKCAPGGSQGASFV